MTQVEKNIILFYLSSHDDLARADVFCLCPVITSFWIFERGLSIASTFLIAILILFLSSPPVRLLLARVPGWGLSLFMARMASEKETILKGEVFYLSSHSTSNKDKKILVSTCVTKHLLFMCDRLNRFTFFCDVYHDSKYYQN